MDALKALLPKPVYTWVLIISALFWLGYMANDVVANVKQHYLETSKLVKISRAICEGVRTHAKMDTAACDVRD